MPNIVPAVAAFAALLIKVAPGIAESIGLEIAVAVPFAALALSVVPGPICPNDPLLVGLVFR
ncbi:MAG: hypothetical protein Q7J38_13525, partial [Gallionella sp.]|nr:hypothetical protein [Gallionella sp.]